MVFKSPGLRYIALLAAGSAALVGCSSSAGTHSGADALAFYRGQTVRWVVPASPGNSLYDNAQIIAPAVAKYLHATVEIVPMPAGDYLVGQDYVAAANPNGLTIGTLNDKTDMVASLPGMHQPSVNFNIEKVKYLGGEGINPVVMVACGGSPFKTFDDVVKTKSTFNSLTFLGSTDLVSRILFAAYNVPAHMVAGYSTQSDAGAGCVRGDGAIDFNAEATSTIVSGIEGHVLKPLLVSAPAVQGQAGYGELKSVPTLAEFVASHPVAPRFKTAVALGLSLYDVNSAANDVFFAPEKTPTTRVDALVQAFKVAMAEKSVQSQLIQAGFSTKYFTPARCKAFIVNVTDHIQSVNQYITYSK